MKKIVMVTVFVAGLSFLFIVFSKWNYQSGISVIDVTMKEAVVESNSISSVDFVEDSASTQISTAVAENSDGLAVADQIIVDDVDSEFSSLFSHEENDHEVLLENVTVRMPEDTRLFESTLVNHGMLVSGNLGELMSLPMDSVVWVNVQGERIKGTLQVSKPSGLKQALYQKVAFSEAGEYMTVYHGENLIKGKIYTKQGAYMYELHDSVGYMISIYEYKKQNNALFSD
ncbi:hypothetical protein [Reinekea sp. G2M2-21]|uniref:hypothetical protein n=1 Tax=Reinekea sp. G2M2-21 TaxID=2788942 RepID=UPI0018AA387F|nr:hypothetical protein [Reinekea sp. G2M2-21]